MIDPFLMLAPILLLPVVALLRFVGCAEFVDFDSYYAGKTKPTVLLDFSPLTWVVNQPVTFTVRVVSTSAPSPTGEVELQDTVNIQTILTTVLLNPGPPNVSTATISIPNLQLGTHSITAEYKPKGDIHYGGNTSQPLVKQVNAVPPPPQADFDLVPNPLSVSIQAGQSTSFTISITPKNGFNAAVDLKTTNTTFPQGATATFVPAKVATSGGPTSARLDVTTKNNTPKGPVQITITAAGNGVTHNADVTLIVT